MSHDPFMFQKGSVNSLPDNNPKTRVGLTKPPLRGIPPSAIILLGQAMQNGVEKYGLFNYRDHEVTASTYYDAMFRHMLAWWDGEELAEDSGVPHLAHVMACCAILLDTNVQGTLLDDRGTPGKVGGLIKALTKTSQ